MEETAYRPPPSGPGIPWWNVAADHPWAARVVHVVLAWAVLDLAALFVFGINPTSGVGLAWAPWLFVWALVGRRIRRSLEAAAARSVWLALAAVVWIALLAFVSLDLADRLARFDGLFLREAPLERTAVALGIALGAIAWNRRAGTDAGTLWIAAGLAGAAVDLWLFRTIDRWWLFGGALWFAYGSVVTAAGTLLPHRPVQGAWRWRLLAGITWMGASGAALGWLGSLVVGTWSTN